MEIIMAKKIIEAVKGILSTLVIGRVYADKAEKEIISQDSKTIKYLVPCYTGSVKAKDLTFQGTAEVSCFQPTEDGLVYAKSVLKIKDLIDINRQRISDGKNSTRVDGNSALELASAIEAFKTNTATSEQIKLVLNNIGKGKIQVDASKLIALLK
jgi:hypothetical protein